MDVDSQIMCMHADVHVYVLMCVDLCPSKNLNWFDGWLANCQEDAHNMFFFEILWGKSFNYCNQPTRSWKKDTYSFTVCNHKWCVLELGTPNIDGMINMMNDGWFQGEIILRNHGINKPNIFVVANHERLKAIDWGWWFSLGPRPYIKTPAKKRRKKHPAPPTHATPQKMVSLVQDSSSTVGKNDLLSFQMPQSSAVDWLHCWVNVRTPS